MLIREARRNFHDGRCESNLRCFSGGKFCTRRATHCASGRGNDDGGVFQCFCRWGCVGFLGTTSRFCGRLRRDGDSSCSIVVDDGDWFLGFGRWATFSKNFATNVTRRGSVFRRNIRRRERFCGSKGCSGFGRHFFFVWKEETKNGEKKGENRNTEIF